MNTMPVVVEVSRSARGYAARFVFCSIECARHNGYEPNRLALPEEYEETCCACGFDPLTAAE